MAEKSEEPKKLLILGGTGRTGAFLVTQALQIGHHVTAIARNPDKMEIKHENLTVCEGDSSNMDSLLSVMEGKDAVLSAMGQFTWVFSTSTFFIDSIKNIVEAMKMKGVKRLIVVSSWCTQPGPNNTWFLEWIGKPLFLGSILKDMAVMEKFLEETDSQEVIFTIVRPPRLTMDPPNGNFKIEEGQCNTGTTSSIPRADVAAFMLKCLETNEYDRKGMSIASL